MFLQSENGMRTRWPGQQRSRHYWHCRNSEKQTEKRKKGRMKFRLSSIKRPTPSSWSMALFLSLTLLLHSSMTNLMIRNTSTSHLCDPWTLPHPHFIGLCCFNPVLLVEKVLSCFFFGSFERMLLARAELSIESLNLSPPTYYVTPPHRSSSIHEFLLSSSHVQHYTKICWEIKSLKIVVEG